MKMFKVERVASVASVERVVVHHRDYDPVRYLSRKQSLVYVISHTRTDAVAFTNDASDEILSISSFECFSLLDKYGRRNVHFSHQQFTFVYLDFVPRVRSVGHHAKGVL